MPKTGAQNKNMAQELEQTEARADGPQTDQAWHDFEGQNIVILRRQPVRILKGKTNKRSKTANTGKPEHRIVEAHAFVYF